MSEPVYHLALPVERASCAVFSSPHSGRDYRAAFPTPPRLSLEQLRSSEDAFVDEIFADAPAFGAPLLAARMPRACVDLNRAPDDLDPALIHGATRRFLNPRIAAGLGVIPRVVAEGRPIVDGKLPLAEAQRRLAAYYHPYHARLRGLLDESRARFGLAILYDCHSMPRDALASAPTVRGRRPNVVLGDRFGAACDRWLIDAATDIFAAAGFVVARNAPFAGGHITQAYGRPAAGVQALQIELDRSLYMDEARVEKLRGFGELRALVAGVAAELARIGPRPASIAAE
ncbi:N-formylglutamate amidohydrolase [Amaricoccus sp.]|uniref:N-formylglutamate amidohydrolase n=1 Tax=Amaricoccus sp. TaxID=1872485 RepID=UPI001B5100DE|nr:N-formylglutamate amidohydrolase [Amaricoccus sp.]MBP7242631.1 N-formylglutamate amidohydrolase [Amaricoccus sp.]